MRFRNTLILLVVALLFLGYFFVIEQPREAKRKKEEEVAAKLTTLKREDIHYVRINSPGKETIEFKRDKDKWWMVSPISDLADAATVNVLVSSIADAEIERKLDPGEVDPTELGLDSASVEVTVWTSSRDTSLALTIGDLTLTKSHFYAQKDTSPQILLLPPTIRRYAIKEKNDFRDKKVADFKVQDVKKFEIASKERSLTWLRDQSGRWITLQAGDTIVGDKYNVDALLRRLRGLRVKEFVSDDPSDFGKYDVGRSMTLWIGEDMATKKLLCGRSEGEQFYAKRSAKNRIVKLDKEFLDVFDKTLDDLREKRLLAFERADVEKISVESPDTAITITRSGSDWTYPNPALGSIEQYRVSSLLSSLENLKFDKVVKERLGMNEGYGFERPSYRITLYGRGDEIIDETKAGKTSLEKSRYVTSRSTGTLALIEQSRIENIIESLEKLRKEE